MKIACELSHKTILEIEISHRSSRVLFLIPTLIVCPKEKVSLTTEVKSLGILWLRFSVQIKIVTWNQSKSVKNYEISDEEMTCILDEIKNIRQTNKDADAAKIRSLVKNSPWLKQIFAHEGHQNSYAIRLLNDQLIELQSDGLNVRQDKEQKETSMAI